MTTSLVRMMIRQPPLVPEHKRSLPSAGDRNAAPGSREWAIAVRLDILGSLHESDSNAEHLDRLVTLFREHAGWEQVEGPDGLPFQDYEAFCVTPATDGGLGYDVAVIDRIITERKDARAKAQHPKSLPWHGEIGRGRNRVRDTKSIGTGADYLIARLARDAPLHLARLQAGTYSSAREAALAAGIIKPRVSVELSPVGFARAACKHLNAEQIADLIEALACHDQSLEPRLAGAGHRSGDVPARLVVGGAVTSVPRVIDRDRRYHDWLERVTRATWLGGTTCCDALLKAAWDEAWRLAVWAGMRENATLGLQVMELKQSIAHLEGRLTELQFEEEVEQGSVYWSSDT